MKNFKSAKKMFAAAIGSVSAMAALLDAASAGEFTFSGAIGAELRSYVQSGLYPDQVETFQPSLQLEPEAAWEEGDLNIYVAPFLRVDSQDSKRTHADLREAYLQWRSDAFTLRAGYVKLFWGVAESRHLVDIINQWDYLEDIDREDKLGQPMLELSYGANFGKLSAYIMPTFRERQFPGSSGRFRTPLPIDDSASIFGGCNNGHCGVDFALRYSHYFGDWDIGVSFFNGFDRDPRLLPDLTAETLIPHYDRITQFGLDLQRTRGAWLWKLEALYRDTPFDRFFASVAGIEYSFYGLAGTAADLGIVVEYQYDGRSNDPSRAPVVFEDNDLFAGFRLALNDVSDTSAIIGAATDLNDGTTYGSLEMSRRIGSSWTLELESRMIFIAKPKNALYPFRKDSNVTVRMKRYF